MGIFSNFFGGSSGKSKKYSIEELIPNLERFKREIENKVNELIQDIQRQNIPENEKSNKIASLESCKNTVIGFYNSLASFLPKAINVRPATLVRIITEAEVCEKDLEENRLLTEKERIKKIREILEKNRDQFLSK